MEPGELPVSISLLTHWIHCEIFVVPVAQSVQFDHLLFDYFLFSAHFSDLGEDLMEGIRLRSIDCVTRNTRFTYSSFHLRIS